MLEVYNTEQNRILYKDERWVLRTPLFILIFQSKEEIEEYIKNYIEGEIELPIEGEIELPIEE